jgi:hypothetical protein
MKKFDELYPNFNEKSEEEKKSILSLHTFNVLMFEAREKGLTYAQLQKLMLDCLDFDYYVHPNDINKKFSESPTNDGVEE